MQDDSQNFRYFSGPLNLCRKTKRADTVMGTELLLSEAEFDALDLLVAQEGEHLTFEQIYKAVWETPDGADNRDAAREALENLIEQVSLAGENFMKIEYSLEYGYVFQTHWGHNWQSRQPQESSLVLRSGEIVMPGESQNNGRRLTIGLLAGVAVAVAIVVFIFTSVMNDVATDAYIIEDEVVPLAARDNGDNGYDVPEDDENSFPYDEITDEEELPEE